MVRTILVLCVLVITPCIVCSCSRVSSTFITKVGEHDVKIISSGPLWGGGGAGRMSAKGSEFTYELDDLKVVLQNEILTVNGKKYVIPKKDDSITIIDGRVEVNGQPVNAEEETGKGA
jgi:hypothetical protein